MSTCVCFYTKRVNALHARRHSCFQNTSLPKKLGTARDSYFSNVRRKYYIYIPPVYYYILTLLVRGVYGWQRFCPPQAECRKSLFGNFQANLLNSTSKRALLRHAQADFRRFFKKYLIPRLSLQALSRHNLTLFAPHTAILQVN